jgi:hypothetical protein
MFFEWFKNELLGIRCLKSSFLNQSFWKSFIDPLQARDEALDQSSCCAEKYLLGWQIDRADTSDRLQNFLSKEIGMLDRDKKETLGFRQVVQ